MSFIFGILLYVLFRVVLVGFYIIEPNERGVKTVWGRVQRIPNRTTLDDPLLSDALNSDQKDRYIYPQVAVIMPGLHFKFPWEKIYKASIATELINIAYDPESRSVNANNTFLEAVTKDQLNIGLRGQLRYTVSERNLYAYIFGVNKPIAHVMGYLISVLRERISNFENPKKETVSTSDRLTSLVEMQGISINDLRKNLGELNRHMEEECKSSAARYGIKLDAALITAIEPPVEVESALAAINTANNEVSSEISLAQASADQKIVQSKRAVEIETLKTQAEVQPLLELGAQLVELKKASKGALATYLHNVRLELFSKANRLIYEMKK